MAKEHKELSEYAIPVHRSIIRRDLWLGIPFVPLILLFLLTAITVFVFYQWYFIIFSVISWFIMNKLTKNDEWLLDIFISSLLQPDDLR